MTKLVPDKLDADCFEALVRTISSNSGRAMQASIDMRNAITAAAGANTADAALAYA
jgi:hypothetical protein